MIAQILAACLRGLLSELEAADAAKQEGRSG
jgi:hypothetical protein